MSKLFVVPLGARITTLEDSVFIANWEYSCWSVSIWYKDTPDNWKYCQKSKGGPIWDVYERDQCTGSIKHYVSRMSY